MTEETIKTDSRDSVFCNQMNAVPFTEIQQQEREFGGWELRSWFGRYVYFEMPLRCSSGNVK